MTERGDGSVRWEGPGLDAWRAWRPAEAADVLAGVAAPWCVVGGWAIELAVGRSHRAHGDLEIAIPRASFPVMRDHLSAFRLYAVGDGEVRALAADELPPPDRHQNWVLDPGANVWRMDVMVEPGDGGTWVFRRDERIRAPRDRMVGSRDGIPFLRPEAALLFKAKRSGEKDEQDLEACLPVMDASARAWLINALRVAHPEHPWLTRLRYGG
jgi:hypothetical protein